MRRHTKPPRPCAAPPLFWSAPRATILLVFFVFLSLAAPAGAQVSCHCFRDRDYDPAQPASVDPYVLATARNSLVAAAAGIPKADVVKMRMTGKTENDVWLSLYLGAMTGRPPVSLAQARSSASSWPAALDAQALDTAALGPAFAEARMRGDEGGMVRALADRALASGFSGAPSLPKLRAAGADNAEAALGLLLGPRLKRQPEAVLEDVLAGRASWGFFLNSAGVAPTAVGDLIAAAFAGK